MMKLVWRIVLVILPVLVIIGLFRMAFHYQEGIEFVPTWDEFVGKMATLPSPYDLCLDAINIYNYKNELFSEILSYGITDMQSFFDVIGSWLNCAGAWFVVAWKVISVPFVYIGWFFQFIAGFA